MELPLSVSAAHTGELTLGVAGPGALGCDLEAVAARPASVWRDLLGVDGIRLAREVMRETGEGLDAAATRVWAGRECLDKAGAAGAPLVVGRSDEDGWVVLASTGLSIPTCVVRLRGGGSAAVAVATSRAGAPLPSIIPEMASHGAAR